MSRASVLVLALVAAQGVWSPLAAQRLAESELVWPLPPEEPRIRYVGFISSEEEIAAGESFFGKLKRTLAGRRPPQRMHIERPFDIYVAGGIDYYFTNGLFKAVVLFRAEEGKVGFLGEDVPGGLGRPMGLGGDGQGNIYVADRIQRRVVKFDGTGRFVRAYGGSGTLLNPVDVAVDVEANRIYVVDSYLHQVVVFNGAGERVDVIGRQVASLSSSAASAAGPEQVQEQSGAEVAEVPLDPDGRVREEAQGEVDRVAEPSDLWQNRGSEPGEFRYPFAAAVGPDGALYVTDQMNFRVQAFDRAGKFLRQFGRLGDTPGSFARPKGIAVGDQGYVYVVDAAFNNVQVFDREGRLLIAFGSLGHGDGQHWLPLGIYVDGHDRIYVADRFNNRAQIYEYLPPTADRNDEGEKSGDAHAQQGESGSDA